MNTTGSIEHKVHPDLASLAVAHQGRSSIQATLNSAMYALGPKRRGRQRVSRSQSPDPRTLLTWQSHLRHITDRAHNRQDETATGFCNILGFHLHLIGDYAGA